jgi:hypothetical protein
MGWPDALRRGDAIALAAIALHQTGDWVTTRETAIAAAEAIARADAALHQHEHPGEPVDGDWDSEAWSVTAADWFAEIDDIVDGGDLWQAYHDELHAEVARLIAA